MLRELVVNNFAIVDRLELSLGPGLTCLTGETGAGKSIMVDAISFLLGGKPGPGIARDGADTSVEAQFWLPDGGPASAILDAQGLGGAGELVLRRVITASGRGKVYVNGSLANVSVLQELGEHLVDLHGQHEHQSLLKVDSHVELLDEHLKLGDARRRARAAYDAVAGIRARVEELSGREREIAQREDMLRFQMSEIDSAAPVDGEVEELTDERAKLAHVDRLTALAHQALDALKESERSAVELVGESAEAVRGIVQLSPAQADTLRLIESAGISLAEAAASLRDFAYTLEADPDRLTDVESRLELIKTLGKKYGDTIADILEYRDRAAEELEGLERMGEDISSLGAKLAEAEAELNAAAGVLSKARAAGAKGFEDRVAAELSDMGMPKAVFRVGISPLGRTGPKGSDRVEFLFSANPGKEPFPLAKIASGGELSRVMLALKVLLTGAGGVPTLVFDEVDSGVGGVTAGAVGRKLKAAADGRQVLCVTHLPQIASMAAEHYTVEKSVGTTGVEVTVRRLDKKQRVDELARMLGGEEGSATASAHAEELVRQGEL